MGKTKDQVVTPIAEEDGLEALARSYYATSMELLKVSSGKTRDGAIDFEPDSLYGQKMNATVYTSGDTESAPMVQKEVNCEFNRDAFETMKNMYDGKDGITVKLGTKQKEGKSGGYTVWCATVTVKTDA